MSKLIYVAYSCKKNQQKRQWEQDELLSLADWKVFALAHVFPSTDYLYRPDTSRPCDCFAMLRRVRNCRCYYYYYYYYYYCHFLPKVVQADDVLSTISAPYRFPYTQSTLMLKFLAFFLKLTLFHGSSLNALLFHKTLF